MYSVRVKTLDTLLFLMFLKSLSEQKSHQACIYLIKDTDKNVYYCVLLLLLQFKTPVFYMNI